jgi:hypothetical protein
VFKGNFGKVLGSSLRMRNTVLSANRIENGCRCLPVARSKLKIVKRENNFQKCFGSTVFGTEIPRVVAKEKCKIFPARKPPNLPESWVEEHGRTEPLCWQEDKPIEVWKSIISDYKIKAIFDLTPGAGALAEAALSECIVYHGVCVAPRRAGQTVSGSDSRLTSEPLFLAC